MAQKVKIASATFKKEGEGKFGKWYLYEVKIEGDDKVYQYMSKSNPQNKFVAGQEIDVEIEKKENGQYTNWSIKPVQQNAGGFGGGNHQRLETDKKIAALNNAVKLVAAGKVEMSQLKATFEKLLTDYLN